MSKRAPILPAIVLSFGVAAATASAPVTLVVCAPGYPGTTKEAQPSMDILAGAVSKATGWPTSRFAAEYYETEDAGIARLKAAAPSLAMVPLPFYLAHAGDLKLTPRAQAVEKDGTASVTWALVAKKGRVASASSLAGFTVVSLAAYAPDFIRNVALANWGKLPADVTFTATGQILSALRKAANGDNVVVLLDASQAASLPTLPFAGELEIVATSPPVPGIVVCSVGTSVGATATNQLIAGILKLNETAEGVTALDAVRLARFVPLDGKGIAAARSAYRSVAKTKSQRGASRPFSRPRSRPRALPPCGSLPRSRPSPRSLRRSRSPIRRRCFARRISAGPNAPTSRRSARRSRSTSAPRSWTTRTSSD